MFEISCIKVNQTVLEFKRKQDEKRLLPTIEKTESSQTHQENLNLEDIDYQSKFLLGIKRYPNDELEGLAILNVLRDKNISVVSFTSDVFFGEDSYLHLLNAVSSFVFDIFPSCDLEIEVAVGNPPHESLLETIGFCVRKEGVSGGIYVYTKKSIYSNSLEFLRKTDIHIVASDAGGAFQISALLTEMGLSASASLQGPALEIFRTRNPQVAISAITNSSLRGKTLLLGSSFYGGFESLALEHPNLEDNVKIVLLDHWMNFRNRFKPFNPILPDMLLVTNELAFQKALDEFPAVEVIKTPDFLLAEYKRKFLASTKIRTTVLVLLEPDAKQGEGMNFPIGKLEKYFNKIEEFALLSQISTIVIRKHPSQNDEEIPHTFNSSSGITWENAGSASLIENLESARAVFGFHSYALYASSMLGVETFGFFAAEKNHWTHSYPIIKRVM